MCSYAPVSSDPGVALNDSCRTGKLLNVLVISLNGVQPQAVFSTE